MIRNSPKLLLVLISTTLFTVLFYKQNFGINITIYALFLAAALHWQMRGQKKNLLYYLSLGGVILSSLSVTLNYTGLAIFLTLSTLFLHCGVVMYAEVRSLLNSFYLSIWNTVLAPLKTIADISSVNTDNGKVGYYFSSVRLFLIPLAVIGLFVLMYSLSNPVFDNMVNEAGLFLHSTFAGLFDFINPILTLVIGLGFLTSIFFFNPSVNEDLLIQDRKASNVIQRIKRKSKVFDWSILALKNEVRSAVFLLIALNLLILTINVIDIYWVWINFSWEGEYLKQFVHEGTYLLIISILISIALVLYYFRGNINHYSKNKTIKTLATIWLSQNAFLVLSVGMRNYWYIQNFALAYKRIGVMIFLILTLIGIATVLLKVRDKRSIFYLFRTNTLSIYIVMVLAACVNWDSVIVNYNLSHYQQSFIHWNFLANMSDKTLAQLDLSSEDLRQIELAQAEKFNPNERYYMTPIQFRDRIDLRIIHFKSQWEDRSWLSWNIPEHRAYKDLTTY